jgi:hypothetical protein
MAAAVAQPLQLLFGPVVALVAAAQPAAVLP